MNENLELQTRKLHQDMWQALKEKDREILELSKQNEELRKYIEKLQNSALKYKGNDGSSKKDKNTVIIYVTCSSWFVVCRIIRTKA